MNNSANDLRNKYKNQSDEAVMDRFAELIQITNDPKSSDQIVTELIPEMNVVMQIMKDRNLSFGKAMQQKIVPQLKDDAKKSWQNGINKGILNLMIGIVVLVLGLAISSASKGRVLFYGAIIFGAVEIIVGLSMLFILLNERRKYPNDF